MHDGHNMTDGEMTTCVYFHSFMSAKWFHDRMGFIGEGVSYRKGLMYLGDNVCVQRWLRTLGLSTPLCHLSLIVLCGFHLLLPSYLQIWLWWEATASVAEWLRAWDTLTMFEATVCGRS